GISRVIHLPFAFAPARRFEVSDESNEVSDHMGAGSFEAFRQSEELFNIGQTLSAIEGCGDHTPELGCLDRKSEEFGKARPVSTLHHLLEPATRTTQRREAARLDRLYDLRLLESGK